MIPYTVNKLKGVKTDKNQEPDTKHRVILKKLGDRGGTSGKVFQSLLQTRCHSLEQPDGGKSRTVSLLLKTRKLQALCFLFARQRGTRGQTLNTHWHQKALHLPESLHADQRLRAGKRLSLSIRTLLPALLVRGVLEAPEAPGRGSVHTHPGACFAGVLRHCFEMRFLARLPARRRTAGAPEFSRNLGRRQLSRGVESTSLAVRAR